MVPIESLEQVVQSAQNPVLQDSLVYVNQLRNLAKKTGGNIILGSLLPVAPPTPVEGDAPSEPPTPAQNDPLDIIDPVHSTLASLFILYVVFIKSRRRCVLMLVPQVCSRITGVSGPSTTPTYF
jgi:hypothetical protein